MLNIVTNLKELFLFNFQNWVQLCYGIVTMVKNCHLTEIFNKLVQEEQADGVDTMMTLNRTKIFQSSDVMVSTPVLH